MNKIVSLGARTKRGLVVVAAVSLAAGYTYYKGYSSGASKYKAQVIEITAERNVERQHWNQTLQNVLKKAQDQTQKAQLSEQQAELKHAQLLEEFSKSKQEETKSVNTKHVCPPVYGLSKEAVLVLRKGARQ